MSAQVKQSELTPHLQRLKHLKKATNVEALIAELTNPLASGMITVRGRAARYLGDLASETAVEPLMKLLHDEETMVRASAARALGKIGSPAAIPALIDALEDTAPSVQALAIGALGEIGDPEVVPRLLPFISYPKWFSSRVSAVYALSLIDDPVARRAAVENVQELRWPLRWYARMSLAQDSRAHRRRVRRRQALSS